MSTDNGSVGVNDKKLKQVNLNRTTATTTGTLYSGNIGIGGNGPITATNLLTAAVNFSNNGTLIVKKGITGNVDFAGYNGLLQLAGL